MPPFQLRGGVGDKFANVLASTVVNLDGLMSVVPLENSSGSISPSLAEAVPSLLGSSGSSTPLRGTRARPFSEGTGPPVLSIRAADLKPPLDHSRITLTDGSVGATYLIMPTQIFQLFLVL